MKKRNMIAALPVSYTHLDVYKRQVAKRIANVRFTADKHSPASSAQSTKRRVAEINEEKELDMRRKQKNNFRTRGKRICITAFFLTGSLMPVSYTHLDVYKRQR